MPVYLHDYVKHVSGSFHSEMFELTERTDLPLTVVVAFRGSAKSTIFSLSYPLWAILGVQKKKYVLIVSRTQQQAKQLLQHIKTELERNELLKQDLGPFEEPDDEWRMSSIVIPKYDARITVLSVDQSMRGLRHKSYRPDLIICDDIEDLASTKTQDSRDKTFNWFTSEIIPAGDDDTKVVLVGNLVHDDSLMVRLREGIESGEIDGYFKSYPFLDTFGNCIWPEKYPTPESIEKLRRKTINQQAWEREYLLKIIPSGDQIIDPLWISHYHEIPRDVDQHAIFVGADLAISQKTSADYTAMIPVLACTKNDEKCLYVLPEIVHARMRFPETCREIKALEYKLRTKYGLPVKFYIENVGYQDAVVQQSKEDDVDVIGVTPIGTKQERISLTAPALSAGRIRFPFGKAEKLIQELINFGSEKHDDLADAFSLVTIETMVNWKPRKKNSILFG